jgi:uncharacterized protein involved in exopolysaccharide biosynthesis
MTFRDILAFLFKWKLLLVGLTVVVVALVVVSTYTLDQSYEAETKVVIESNRLPTKRDEFAPSGALLAELLTTEAEIVQSRTVMSKVVDELRPHERAQKHSAWRTLRLSILDSLSQWGLLERIDPREVWILRLMKEVKAKPVVNSAVLRLVYEDSDPQWAARIVNSATEHFIRLHLAVYAPRGVAATLKQQHDQAERELDAARAALRDYKQKMGVTAISVNRQELVRSNVNFNEELVQARGELAELRLRYAAGHDKLQLSEQRVTRLENIIAAQKREISRLEREESSVKAYADAVENAESKVRNLRQRYDDAKSEEAATTDVLNVRVIALADVPLKPVYPRILLIGLSLPIGFALALGLALLFEYFDRRVRDPSSAQALLGLPSLGSIPRLSRARLAEEITPRGR